MKRKMNLCLMMLVFGFAVIVVFISQPAWAKRGGSGGRGDGPVIYVTSQGLFFDSIITADPLPPNGFFQKLEMDEGDKYFLCPLLGPGRVSMW